jgi:pyrroline-5-carboxylate reductase
MSVITAKRTVIRRMPNKRSAMGRSFRELTRGYFASEKTWEFVIEALLFAIMVAVSAWPIIAAADALNEFLQRTPT